VSQRIANRDLPQFSRKLQSYAKIHQIDVPKGLMLLIPKSMLNPNTGKPTPELVNFFKQKIVL
jgi:peptidyl-tRNA hydrolase